MKRKAVLLLLACFYFFKITAQTCITPLGCGNDLRSPVYTGQIDTLTSSYARVPISFNFKDVRYAPIPNSQNCSGPTSTTCTNNPNNPLRYKAYYPHDYANCSNLPVIIIIHGGGFLDCKDGYEGTDMVGLCQEFVKRGFVAVDMQYRLGAYITNGYYTAQQLLAIYRAAQDVRGCIRTLIKRQRANEPSPPLTSLIQLKCF